MHRTSWTEMEERVSSHHESSRLAIISIVYSSSYFELSCASILASILRTVYHYTKHYLFYAFVLFMCFYNFRNGLSRTGSEFGPLTELPDWSFAGNTLFTTLKI